MCSTCLLSPSLYMRPVVGAMVGTPVSGSDVANVITEVERVAHHRLRLARRAVGVGP